MLKKTAEIFRLCIDKLPGYGIIMKKYWQKSYFCVKGCEKCTQKYGLYKKHFVVNHALKNGVYYPEFGYSDYLEENHELSELYDFLLSSYCELNKISCNGLLFEFWVKSGNALCHFDNYKDYVDLMRSKNAANAGSWNHFLRDDYVVELGLDTDLNLLPIDLNDLQFLMPPITLVSPYTEDDINRLRTNLSRGVLADSPFPSDLIQVHLPYMAKENIVGIYPMFEI